MIIRYDTLTISIMNLLPPPSHVRGISAPVHGNQAFRNDDGDNKFVMMRTPTVVPEVRNGISAVPSFILKHLIPNEMMKKYKEGYHRTLEIPKTPITISDAIPLMAVNYGTNHNDEKYTFKDQSGGLIIMLTTNHQRWTAYHRSGRIQPPGGTCAWHKGPFSHQGVGVPQYIFPVMISPFSTSEEIEYAKTVGYARFRSIYEDIACSHECALSHGELLDKL